MTIFTVFPLINAPRHLFGFEALMCGGALNSKCGEVFE